MPGSTAIAGYCPACGHQSLRAYQDAPEAEAHITCANLDCPQPTVVDELLQEQEIEHIAVFDPFGQYTLQHPLRERAAGDLMTCRLHRWLAGTARPARSGRYRIVSRYDGWTFEMLDG